MSQKIITKIQYSVYSYHGRKCESFDTSNFEDFAARIAKLAANKDRGEVYVSSKELKSRK